MGVAIGGDYPLSAIITSEFAPAKIRGRMMTVVFAAQGWGNLSEFLCFVRCPYSPEMIVSCCPHWVYYYCCFQDHHSS